MLRKKHAPPNQDLALGKDVREVGRKARHPDFVMLWDQVPGLKSIWKHIFFSRLTLESNPVSHDVPMAGFRVGIYDRFSKILNQYYKYSPLLNWSTVAEVLA